MPDYSWEYLKQIEEGNKPRFVSGGINLDMTTYPGYWTNATGQRVNAQGQPVVANTSMGTFGVGTGAAQSGQLATGSNPYWTISNVKSQPIQDAVNKQLEDWAKSRTSQQSAIEKFKSESDASRSSARGFLDTENRSVGDYFNGAVQSKLDELLNKWATSDQASQAIAKGEAIGAYNDLGLTGRSDIYRNRMIDQALAKINAEASARRANQEFANYQWLEGMKRGLLGQRGAAESAWVDTGLKPLQAQITSEQALANLLAQINAADKANMFYGTATNYNPWTPNVGYVPQIWPNQGYGFNYPSNYGVGYNPYTANAVRNFAATNYQLPQNYTNAMAQNPNFTDALSVAHSTHNPISLVSAPATQGYYPWEMNPELYVGWEQYLPKRTI